jgi:hypothetical protein
VVATLFQLFGPTILVERMWDAAVRAGLAALAYALSREFTNRSLAAMVWLFSLAWLWFVGSYGYPLLPAALFGLASAYLLIKYATGTAGGSAVLAAGACAAVAGLFRHDMGAYTFAAAAAAICAGIGRSEEAIASEPRKMGGRASALVRLTVGALAVAVPAIVYLALQMPLVDVLHPLVIYPFTIYPAMRSLPLPSLIEPVRSLISGGWIGGSIDEFAKALAIYFPWVVSVIGAIALWRARRKKFSSDANRGWRVALLVTLLLVLAFSMKVVVRPHVVHVIHALVPAFVLTVLLIAPNGQWQLTARTATLFLLMGVLAYPPLFAAYRNGELIRADERVATSSQPESQQEGQSPASANYFQIDSDQASAVAYIRKNTSNEDKIFVANGRHDVAFANDVLFYFLAQRRPATKYYEFNPGLTTTSETQTAIVNAIDGAQVPYVIIFRGFDEKKEPNESAVSSGVTDLDHALNNDYAEVARFGKYEIRKRRLRPRAEHAPRSLAN